MVINCTLTPRISGPALLGPTACVCYVALPLFAISRIITGEISVILACRLDCIVMWLLTILQPPLTSAAHERSGQRRFAYPARYMSDSCTRCQNGHADKSETSVLIRLFELIEPVLGLSLSYSLRGDERRHEP